MRLRGLLVLVRFVPVLSWSFCAIILGTSVVLRDRGWLNVNYWHLALVFVSALLLQGIIAHAYNDIKDWRSGTDQLSPGILSGGSRVIPRLLLNMTELAYVAVLGIIAVIAIAIYFVIVIGVEVLVFLFIGLWAAIAYSCAPLHLAYRSWMGEWLCAWPAMVACTVGTSYVLSGGHWYIASILLGMVHATFSVTWLMMHHIPDIEADIQAQPPKWTSVAYLKVKEGWEGVVRLIKGYIFIVLMFALITSFFLDRFAFFFIPLIASSIIFFNVEQTDLSAVDAVTRLEFISISLTFANAMVISWVLLT